MAPVISGLIYVLMFGAHGVLGPWSAGARLAHYLCYAGNYFGDDLCDVPVCRAGELIPVMQSTGTDQEEAALVLGANGWQTFWRVTLPSVKWGLLYGVILCNARAMGEFGAVSVVSGHIRGVTKHNSLARGDPLQRIQFCRGVCGGVAFWRFFALITLGAKAYVGASIPATKRAEP